MTEVPQAVEKLVELFGRNIETYRGGRYNETQVRREFIDPFFAALGWDVDNHEGNAEAYKDVIHEDAIKVGGVTKAPDYCFRIGGTRKFFVEAKKPAVNLAQDANPAYQLRRYAWSAKLPLSILTDFEEFAVYDCRVRPRQGDKPSVARVMYFKYDQYIENWPQIAAVFAKKAVLQGSFDKYAAGKKKRGTAEVDAEFLKEIENWRTALARNIALRNAGQKLGVRDINFAVQRTIDRIIFLRMCEDRGVESYGSLLALIGGDNVYSRLMQLFRVADDRYNSGLFHFDDEKGRDHAPDTLTPGLAIDDKVLKDIFRALYYPQSPYEFSVLPADILGNVYEQFLGKVIHLSPAGRASVEEKPEVKKAGGVYYTPRYIVDYIVKHTIGKLIAGEAKKTPRQIAKLRFLDPACGSGSFVVGAYKFLLDYHRDWYLDEKNGGPGKHTKEIYQGAGGQWYLTSAVKKSILLNNIYGVDIDPQAVEVTKLNLLLCALENENQNTIGQLALIHQRALPDLVNNIKCGNSLIGPDFYEGKQLSLFDEESQYKINAFNWKEEFPEAFKSKKPGFDAVIGNPPYGAAFEQQEKKYLQQKFTCQTYQLDSYQLFLEQVIRQLLISNGLLGMIFPNPWLTNILQTKIRRFITGNTKILEIVHFRFPIFRKVTVDTEIVILEQAEPKNWKTLAKIVDTLNAFTTGETEGHIQEIIHLQNEWISSDGGVINIFMSSDEKKLFRKIDNKAHPLSLFCKINVGIKPYQKGKGKPPQTRDIVTKRVFDSDIRLDNSYRMYLRGCDINRYKIEPLASRYIKYGPWLAEPRPSADFDAPVKIFMRQTGDRLIATIDREKYLCLNNMHILVPLRCEPGARYLLGLISSRLLNWYYRALNPEVGEALAEVKKTNVAKLPIHKIDFSDSSDKAAHDRMVELVEGMLGLHRRLADARTPQSQELVQRQITATDKQIDNLVYELYGLTEEEIAIVETS
ncbi:MAG: N-6 DNA methylase [Phycisphaerae bacterium]|nr:N-6 DNA methylase [Phycisphaerae bacterium]